MMRSIRALLFLIAALISAHSQTVVFFEDGFPSAESSPIPRKILSAALPSATFAGSTSLSQALTGAKLLVLPYGSAFPESDWPAILNYLQYGGNLLVIGGRPFTRAAYHESGHWKLRDYSVRFSRQFLINDYAEISIESDTHSVRNPDLTVEIPSVSPSRVFSPIVRLSTKDVYPTEGSAGSLDARLDSIQWIDRGRDHIAAPVISIDHLASTFAGGRWVFVASELSPKFVEESNAARLIASSAAYAARGAEDFSARPTQATFLPGEPIELRITAHARGLSPTAQATFELLNDRPVSKIVPSSPLTATSFTLPAVSKPGYYPVQITFTDGDHVLRTDHFAFWVRDDAALNSGPHITAGKDFFLRDGKPAAMVGTTYMSSDVQRLFLMQPNPAVWDRDMQQIHSAGLNMIRTGLWSGWLDVTNDDGSAKEEFLRNLEAFLLTARRHDLFVQFTFFSFLPESFGGLNSYLDPISIQKQQNFVRSIAQRFKDVPFLSFDLINEPSFSRFTWQTRPNGDKFELSAWNRWLQRKYPDWPALADLWNMPDLGPEAPVPTADEFKLRGAYFGNNGLKVNDFYLFSQDVFAHWSNIMKGTIRDAGSSQLITVGQDDGGYQERANSAFFSDEIDFTTNHTWWLNDDLLWCSLIAKQPGKPMLIQETGLQRQITPRETARLTPEEEAALLERKLAMSFASGSGAIEWLWNVNPYMTSDNEVTIGAVRADGTFRPDADVLKKFAAFAVSASPYLSDFERPEVAIVTSQALQYSPWNAAANTAQQHAVRAMFYHARIPAYIVPENRIATDLGRPKLVVLPSLQALSEPAWQSLLDYVHAGGHLLVTGPVERDEHWRDVQRMKKLGVDATLAPLTSHEVRIELDKERLTFNFGEPAQENLEILRFNNAVNIQTTTLEKGSITWIAAPIELTDGLAQVGRIYSYAAQAAGIVPRFQVTADSSAVLVYPQVMKDGVLYLVESESDREQKVGVRDAMTKAKFELTLPAQHAVLLIQNSNGKLVAHYGF